MNRYCIFIHLLNSLIPDFENRNTLDIPNS
jgi:hypothetical protein